MKYLLSFFLFVLAPFAIAQISESPDDAFRLSEAEGKPLLLLFEGSDWCAPCVKFEKEVLSSSRFDTYAKERLVLFRVDFPQRKKVPKEIRARNDALAEKYNPKGVFPCIAVIRPGGSMITSLSYNDESAIEFIFILDRILNDPTSGIPKTN